MLTDIAVHLGVLRSMNADELRAIQAPFKERYRNEPEAAGATLLSAGDVDFDRLSVRLTTRPALPPDPGMHPMTGGDGSFACAAEMLLESLVGCAGVTLAAVCTAMSIPVASARLVAEGVVDFRGTLGVSRNVPVGFSSIVLTFEYDSEASDDILEKATQLADRYCVVAQSLKQVQATWRRTTSGT